MTPRRLVAWVCFCFKVSVEDQESDIDRAFDDLDPKDPHKKGRDLHMGPNRVPPSRWCVTLKDLDRFERDVRIAWQRGTIPNGTGQFFNKHHDDPKVGPTMYQVCDHFIKPLSERAGGMSYALLHHPEGLDCDIFVTHAWAEGIFEFCDKVRRACPLNSERSGLYICFLANPQVLDISELLNVHPAESPFAQAMTNAKYMIVIPNMFITIYDRLWCVYEAFLAVKQGKIIQMPLRVTRQAKMRLLAFVFLLPTLLGAAMAIRLLADPVVFQISDPVFLLNTYCVAVPFFQCLVIVLLMLAVLCNDSLSLCCFSLFGGSINAFNGYAQTLLMWIALDDSYKDDNISIFMSALVINCLNIFPAWYLGISIVRRDERLFEASELVFESVRSAKCTSSDDERRIRAAIEGAEDEVDESVRTLEESGVSTEQLRHMHALGVDTRGASDNSILLQLPLCFVLWFWPIFPVYAFWGVVPAALLLLSVLGFGAYRRPFAIRLWRNSGIIVSIANALMYYLLPHPELPVLIVVLSCFIVVLLIVVQGPDSFAHVRQSIKHPILWLRSASAPRAPTAISEPLLP